MRFSRVMLAALKAIQGSQVARDFVMPEGEPGAPVDPDKVNVNYSSGASRQTLGQVARAADCENNGCYYDDPDAPSRIVLCPSSCSTIQADPDARFAVLLGCATEALPPPP